jgi:hypothetical protein
MGPRPPGKILGRINVNKNYGPTNCEWTTWTEQGRRRRNNHLLTFEGRTLPISAWAELTSQKYHTISKRANKGWSDRSAVLGNTVAKQQRIKSRLRGRPENAPE